MLCKDKSMKINGKSVRCAPGTWQTYNIIYVVRCKLCETRNGYFGRSTRRLNTRIGEHRQSFYKVIEGVSFDATKDDFSLGLHLYQDHGFTTRKMFDKTYEVTIVENASP